MSETFENQNLGGAVFRNVNLGGAIFDDVNLAGATINSANLGGVRIENAGIRGMTIFGIRVDELIEAELDRRDPERARLRMKDRHDPETVRAVMARLDEVRAGFGVTLRAAAGSQLTARPQSDEWSPLENVRHLVFAEDMYAHRWIACDDVPWCELGLLPDFLARDPDYAGVGTDPSEDLEAVLAAWDGIHACTRAFVARATREDLLRDTSGVDFGQGTVGGVLQGLALHDLHHIRLVEEMLAQGAAGSQ
jgi:hypothetical protein